MEGGGDIQAILDMFGVGNYALMLGICVLAYKLRTSNVRRVVAVWFPTLAGGLIGVLAAIVSVEGKGLSPAALTLVVLTGFVTHGAAATLVARYGYAALQKLLPPESPPESETKDGGA